jgi:hypothetical protein
VTSRHADYAIPSPPIVNAIVIIICIFYNCICVNGNIITSSIIIIIIVLFFFVYIFSLRARFVIVLWAVKLARK